DDCYGRFKPRAEKTEAIERSSVGSSRDLWADPKTGKKVTARLGRVGPIAQLGETVGEENPESASLRKGQWIESRTLEDPLELFKLPREIGEYEDKKMVAARGTFGPYIRHDSKFYSLPKEEGPHSVSYDKAIEIIQAKRKADAEKFIKGFEENPDVQILNGRWGPYIKVGKQNVKIPKDRTPEDLTLEECLQLAEEAPAKKGRGKTTTKKATTKASATAKKKAKPTTKGKKAE